jgi:hypothetical protein
MDYIHPWSNLFILGPTRWRGYKKWPTLLNDKIQTIVQLGSESDNSGNCLCLNQLGQLCFIVRSEISDDVIICSQESLKLRTWYRVWASYDGDRQILEIGYSVSQYKTSTVYYPLWM